MPNFFLKERAQLLLRFNETAVRMRVRMRIQLNQFLGYVFVLIFF